MFSASAAKPSATYSAARFSRQSTQLHVSGQVPRDTNGRTVGQGDFPTQCRQVYNNIVAILAPHGLSMADVDSVLVFVTRPELIREASAIRGEFFSDPYPACTSVAVSALADPAWMIEIAVTASAR